MIGIIPRPRIVGLPHSVKAASAASALAAGGAFVYETYHMGVVYSYVAALANNCRVKDVSGCDLLFRCVGTARSNNQVNTLYHYFVSPSIWVPIHILSPPSLACPPQSTHVGTSSPHDSAAH